MISFFGGISPCLKSQLLIKYVDPVIARYYPNNENSIREFGEIYYNMIDLGWSGTIDIWTYDERHFIGFNILEGELTSTVRYDTGIEENAKLINGHNYLTLDCYRITTTVTYTYTTTGFYETTIVATQNYATICSGGGSASPGYGNDSGTYYDYGGTFGYGSSGSYGAVEEQTYAPPIITSPTIKIEKEDEDQIIKDPSFEGTKADCVYEKLLDLSGGFKNAIKKFDGEFPVAHLRFKMSDLGQNVRGLTSPPQNYVIDITLNNNASTSGVDFRPNLLTAKTIIHEVIHAEMFRKMLALANSNGNIDVLKLNNMLNNGDYPGMLDYYTRYGVNGFQHQQMAQHYRETIGRVLQEFDTGIALNNSQTPQQKYMDFAWEGLKHSNLIAWQNVISPEERSRINGVIQNYIDAFNNQNCQYHETIYILFSVDIFFLLFKRGCESLFRP